MVVFQDSNRSLFIQLQTSTIPAHAGSRSGHDARVAPEVEQQFLNIS